MSSLNLEFGINPVRFVHEISHEIKHAPPPLDPLTQRLALAINAANNVVESICNATRLPEYNNAGIDKLIEDFTRLVENCAYLKAEFRTIAPTLLYALATIKVDDAHRSRHECTVDQLRGAISDALQVANLVAAEKVLKTFRADIT